MWIESKMKDLLVLVLKLAVGLSVLTKDDGKCCSNKRSAEECGMVDTCQTYVWDRKADASSVSIDVYGESLCPDTIRFITTQLYPTWREIGSIMNVKFIPYGKATQRKSGNSYVFTCQHGSHECEGNKIFTCAIRMYPVTAKWLPFVNCVEGRVNKGVPIEDCSRTCAHQHGIDFDQVNTCAGNATGTEWEHEMGDKTEALNPRLNYVPWIVVNSKRSKMAETLLKEVVCQSYQGKLPGACLGHVSVGSATSGSSRVQP